MAVLLLLARPADCFAIAQQDSQENPQLVTNMFYDTSVRQALADISAQTGIVIIPDESVRGFVTCELKDVPLDDALNMLLATGGFVFRKMEGYILVGSSSPDSPMFYRISETREIELNYVKAKDVVNVLPESLCKFAKANESNDTVCVTATPDVLERIAADIKAMDRPPKQLLLEARVVEMTKEHGANIGTDAWLWSDNDTELSWTTLNGAFEFLNIDPDENTEEFTRTLFAHLSLFVENDWASIIASPRITAQDGSPATIKVSTEEYFLVTVEGYYYSSDLEKIESGITLEVTPQIGDDGEITLHVKPEVSNVVGLGSDDLPVITRRTVETTVRVKDGGTAVIAGLMSNLSRKKHGGLPFIGDIPIIGWLFSKDVSYEAERQIAVFITPKIIDFEKDNTAELTRRKPVEPVGREFKEELQRCLARMTKE